MHCLKSERFLGFLRAIKCICSALWAFLQNLPFHIFQLAKSLPFSLKKVPLARGSLPVLKLRSSPKIKMVYE